jgi:cell wall-associated NlpC family hydrolase
LRLGSRGHDVRVLQSWPAIAPAGASDVVKAAIAAGNRINRKPYRYGGGHGRFNDRGYDCSGAVSYVLHAAGLLDRPRDSSGLESWGTAGRGSQITVYANAGHAFMVVAGLRFDTSGAGEDGPRWRPERRSGRGYVIRHAPGL